MSLSGTTLNVLVLTPFCEPVRSFYGGVIHAVAAKIDATFEMLSCEVAAGQYLIERLMAASRSADVVVAVLDLQRPNVIFEIGFVRALGHDPICVTQSGNPIAAFLPDACCHDGDRRLLIDRLCELIPARAARNHAIAVRQTTAVGLDAASGTPSELVESLARTVHQRWQEQRRAEGWSFGSRRNDIQKTHPGMVDYEMLSDSEREYDRQTALATLQAMVELGYRITR